jgi:uncharacterized protein YdeI (YjbR/CyaY-like superfamily)
MSSSSGKKSTDSALEKAFPNGEITLTPKNRSDWRNWLSKNYADKKFEEGGLWLVYYKKESSSEDEDRPTLTYLEAVLEGLCFGWIDSTARKIDIDRWGQYFRPRKAGSDWSRTNKTRVEELEKEGLMTDAGRAAIERAKKDGSWTRLDDVEDLIIPDDLRKALKEHEGAETFFEDLRDFQRKMSLHWLSTAKRADTRSNRIQKIAENAAEGKFYYGGSFVEPKAPKTPAKVTSKSGKKRKRRSDDDDDE